MDELPGIKCGRKYIFHPTLSQTHKEHALLHHPKHCCAVANQQICVGDFSRLIRSLPLTVVVGEHQNAMLGQTVSNVSISPTVLSCSMGNKHQRPDGGKMKIIELGWES